MTFDIIRKKLPELRNLDPEVELSRFDALDDSACFLYRTDASRHENDTRLLKKCLALLGAQRLSAGTRYRERHAATG